jgi:peptidylprolyl isomerase
VRLPLVIPALLVAISACASEPAPVAGENSAECSENAGEVTVSGELGSKPSIELPDSAPPCDLRTTDLVVGEGEAATAGANLSMQYVGVSWSTGTQFDASWDREQPFEFSLGSGQVIPGWDQGIEGMKEGGRRVLEIPSELGYGESGQGDIAPGETLVFVVDLLAVEPPPEPLDCQEGNLAASRANAKQGEIVVNVTGEAGKRPKIEIPDRQPPPELDCVDIIEGDGAVAASGANLKMEYVGVSWSNGKTFDASWGRSPFEFQLGGGQVIPGWDQGILGMKAGGRRLLVIPPDLAYGPSGAGGVIGPNETLVFVVDLVEVA